MFDYLIVDNFTASTASGRTTSMLNIVAYFDNSLISRRCVLRSVQLYHSYSFFRTRSLRCHRPLTHKWDSYKELKREKKYRNKGLSMSAKRPKACTSSTQNQLVLPVA